MGMKLRFGGIATDVVAKTASYTIKARDNGTLFTNRGAAGSITFTLPKITTAQGGGLKGVQFEFFTVVGQTIVVTTDPADKLVADSLADATSITIGAASAAGIGQHVRVVADGTGWLAISDPSAASAATAVRAVTITA